MYFLTIFPVPGRCEKNRWGTNPSHASSLHQRRITNLHGCMFVITLVSTLIIMLKEFDILNHLHRFALDDEDASVSYSRTSSSSSLHCSDNDGYACVNKKSDAFSHNKVLRSLCTKNLNLRQRHHHLNSLPLSLFPSSN